MSSRSAISRLVASSLRARRLAVEHRGQPRAIEAEGLHLRGQGVLVAVYLAPALHGGVERVEGHGQAFDGVVDGALLTHAADTARDLKKSCGGNCLEQ